MCTDLKQKVTINRVRSNTAHKVVFCFVFNSGTLQALLILPWSVVI